MYYAVKLIGILDVNTHQLSSAKPLDAALLFKILSNEYIPKINNTQLRVATSIKLVSLCLFKNIRQGLSLAIYLIHPISCPLCSHPAAHHFCTFVPEEFPFVE